MKRLLFLLATIILTVHAWADNPKREFRGAWLHVVGPIHWADKTTAQQKKFIKDQFDKLEEAGCNAVIFQVRPAADALYKSELEPWSKYLTGKRGKAPSEDWDPMEYAIKEAHDRGMEFHAWINPYRVTLTDEVLPADHDSKKHPERYLKYAGQVFFDPAYQENRDFICKVIEDIVTRYDVDAIHLDDYFYPYPKDGKPIPDDKSYAKFGNGKNRGDWRRQNVDLLIERLHKTIKSAKPWVRLGISPFGIWRNKKSDPEGSNTNGLENYDKLYADVLLWAKKGWIDYLAPQLYWSLNHKLASSEHLAKWWNDHTYGVDLYIGHDTRQTMTTTDYKTGASNELDSKIKLGRSLENVKGNVWWHGYWVTENFKGVHDKLTKNYQSTLALVPAYGDKSIVPESVSGLKVSEKGDEIWLEWNAPKQAKTQKETDVVKFVVYEFLPDEDPNNLDNAVAITCVTPFNSLILGKKHEEKDLKGNTYVVTALDRMNRESKPVKVKF